MSDPLICGDAGDESDLKQEVIKDGSLHLNLFGASFRHKLRTIVIDVYIQSDFQIAWKALARPMSMGLAKLIKRQTRSAF
jgi:hypothetical protein